MYEAEYDASEAFDSVDDVFAGIEYVEQADFEDRGIVDISGRIYGQNGRPLVAWWDAGEWRYCLVEEVDEA
jgi:hypothetical protein